MKKVIKTGAAPTPGKYSQGVLIDPSLHQVLYISGMAADFPEDSKEKGCDGPDDIAVQTRRCIKNIQGVLHTAGGDLSDIVKVDARIVDIEKNFNHFDLAYGEFFGDTVQRPARIVSSSVFPWPGYLILMDAVAYIPK